MKASAISQGILCGAGAGALWGLVFLAPELVRGFSPMYLTLGRYLCYGILSVLLLAPRWKSVTMRLRARDWLTVGGLALIGNLVYYLLLSTSVQRVGMATTSLVIGLLPVTVSLVGTRERGSVPLCRLMGPLSLCALGACCIGLRACAGTGAAGLLYATGALTAWTWFAIVNSRCLARLPEVTEHDWNLLTGGVTGILALGLTPLVPLESHSPGQWGRLVACAAAVALLASIGGNALWNRMSRLLPLTLVGPMILFETLFALIYGFLWEGRWPTVPESSAFTLIILGVLTCIWAHQEEPPRVP